MIETICILLLFIALLINVPVLIVYLIGLKFQITDYNCGQEVKNVKRNILMTKVIQGINVVIMLILMILLNI